MEPFPPLPVIRPLIELAKLEDLGPKGDDVTSRLTIPEDRIGVGTLVFALGIGPSVELGFLAATHSPIVARVVLRDVAVASAAS